MYTYKYTYTCTYTYVATLLRTATYTNTWTHTYYRCTNLHNCTFTYLLKEVLCDCTYKHIHVYIYMYVNIYTHRYAYIPDASWQSLMPTTDDLHPTYNRPSLSCHPPQILALPRAPCTHPPRMRAMLKVW